MAAIIKSLRILFGISVLIWLIAAVCAAINLFVYPEFNQIPPVLARISVVLGVIAFHRDREGHFAVPRVILGILLLGAIQAAAFIAMLLNPREGHFESTSPGGAHTIIIEYDLVSRPYLYYKHDTHFMSPIPFSFGPGYNETVRHQVEWESETAFALYDYKGNVWNVDITPYVNAR